MTTAPLPRPPLRDRPRLMRELLSTPERALDELSAHGPVCALGAGPLRMAVVGAPGLIRELLVQPNDRFRYDVPLSPFPTVVGKRSLLASDGDDHRRRRGAVAGSLSRRSLARWVPMIVERTDAAIDGLLADLDRHDAGHAGGPVVDMYPIGRRLVLDIVVQALFGTRLPGRLDEIDAHLLGGQRFLASSLWRQHVPLPSGVRATARRDRQALDAIVTNAIAQVRADPASDDGDVLEQLVRQGELTDEEICDQVKSLIGAGFDTTASTLAWIAWEATLCPGLWDRLRHEADAVLGPAADATDGSLAELRVADATARETLRLHPASGVAARTTAVDIEVGPYEIGRNTIVLWSPYVAGRDPATWDDPLRFDPQRFIADAGDAGGPDPSARAVRHNVIHEAWLPFGRGPRMCVGFALAQMELTLITARIAQRLDLTATADAPPAAHGLVVSTPVGGAPMRVRPRR